MGYKKNLTELKNLNFETIFKNEEMFKWACGHCTEDEIMIESWAEGVETIITNRRFNSIDGSYNSVWNKERQKKPLTQINECTPLVIDLVDDINQQADYGASRPIDRVEGYSLNQIQETLRHSESLAEWRDRLKEKYWNTTEEFLEELFNQYRD